MPHILLSSAKAFPMRVVSLLAIALSVILVLVGGAVLSLLAAPFRALSALRRA